MAPGGSVTDVVGSAEDDDDATDTTDADAEVDGTADGVLDSEHMEISTCSKTTSVLVPLASNPLP